MPREVELAVAGQVGCDDRVGAVDRPEVQGRAEPPSAVAQHHGHEVLAEAGEGHVELAVRVEVAGRDAGRQVARRVDPRWQERARSRAEEDAKLVREPRRREDVDVPVSVEVGSSALPRLAADAIANRRTEGPVAVAEQNGYVGAPAVQTGHV